MDRDEVIAMLRRGPVRVPMNDGSEHAIISYGERTLVSSLTVHSLYCDENDWQWRCHCLAWFERKSSKTPLS